MFIDCVCVCVQWRLIGCGYYPVEFADFWLADQLNSLTVLLLDSEFLLCFYITDYFSTDEGVTNATTTPANITMEQLQGELYFSSNL